VGAGSPEQSYSVLCHLHLLVMRAPMLFSSDYKSFYCQYSDPSYVKKLKLEMLTAIANESNTYEIGISDIKLPTIMFYVLLIMYHHFP
jgi:vesicle coat complex subunit